MATGLWDRLQQGTPPVANMAQQQKVTKRDERLRLRRLERQQRHTATEAPKENSSFTSREQSYLQKRNRRLHANPDPPHPDPHPIPQLHHPQIQIQPQSELQSSLHVGSPPHLVSSTSPTSKSPVLQVATPRSSMPDRKVLQEVQLESAMRPSSLYSPNISSKPEPQSLAPKSPVVSQPPENAPSWAGPQEEEKKRLYREELDRQMAERDARSHEIPIKPYVSGAPSSPSLREQQLQREMQEVAASLALGGIRQPQQRGLRSIPEPHSTFHRTQHLNDNGMKEQQQRAYAHALEEQIQQKAAAKRRAAVEAAGDYGLAQAQIDIEKSREVQRKQRQQAYAQELNNQIQFKRSLTHKQPQAYPHAQPVRWPAPFGGAPTSTQLAEQAARERKVEAQERYRLQLLQQQAEKLSLEQSDRQVMIGAGQMMARMPTMPQAESTTATSAVLSSHQAAPPSIQTRDISMLNGKPTGSHPEDEELHTRFSRSVTNPLTEAESLEKKQKQQQQFAELSLQVEQVRKRKAEEKARREEEERKEAARIEQERKAMHEAFEREEKRKSVEQRQQELQQQIQLKQAQEEARREKEKLEEARDEERIQRQRAEMDSNWRENKDIIKRGVVEDSQLPSVAPEENKINITEDKTSPRAAPWLAKNVQEQKEELAELKSQAKREREQHQRMRQQVQKLQSRLDLFEKEGAKSWQAYEVSQPISRSVLPPTLPFELTLPKQAGLLDKSPRVDRSLEDFDQSLVCESKFVFPDGRTLSEALLPTLTESELTRPGINVAVLAGPKVDRHPMEKDKGRVLNMGSAKEEKQTTQDITGGTSESASRKIEESAEEDSWSIDTNEIHLRNEKRYDVLSRINSTRAAHPDQLDLLLKQFEEEKDTLASARSDRIDIEKLGGSTRWLSVTR